MKIVVTNLIDNSIKYTPKNGNIQITIEENDVYVKIKVKDNGIGMTALEKQRAFDEFFRAKNKFTEKVPGTGLGLSLVKRLVELHQGSVDLETAPNKGSTFTVNIPLIK
jgi:two-component system phosphate regulon sensor histidine kinase PhoR